MDEEINSELEPFSGGSSDEYMPDTENGTSSDSEDCEVMQKKNRKSTDKSKWARNQKKKMLATGKKHLNTCNKLIGPRVVGNNCKCKLKCFEKFNEQERSRILRRFNKIGDKRMQDTYLCGLISTTDVIRKRPKTGNGRQRSVSHKYTVSFHLFLRLILVVR